MFVVFYSTNDVFRAEEILNGIHEECKIVPTPVQDKAYCGVCLKVDQRMDVTVLSDFEYHIIMEG